METRQHISTVALERCGLCNNSMRETDKFCRMCGARRQGSAPIPVERNGLELRSGGERPFGGPVAGEGGGEWYSPTCQISGPLVKALIEAASPRVGSCCGVVKNGLVAIISLTVWIMLVLLAPFEAYVTAKSITRYH